MTLTCTFVWSMSTQGEELQDRAIVRIAAHLPDLIVYGDFCPERPSVDYFDGVLMFVDISGKHDRDVQCGQVIGWHQSVHLWQSSMAGLGCLFPAFYENIFTY